jgi:hypothetical protein
VACSAEASTLRARSSPCPQLVSRSCTWEPCRSLRQTYVRSCGASQHCVYYVTTSSSQRSTCCMASNGDATSICPSTDFETLTWTSHTWYAFAYIAVNPLNIFGVKQEYTRYLCLECFFTNSLKCLQVTYLLIYTIFNDAYSVIHTT